MAYMYCCYICDQYLDTVGRFKHHLKVHRDNNELICPILCRQPKCKSCFAKLSNFLRHINSYHTNENKAVTACPSNEQEVDATDNVDVDDFVDMEVDNKVQHTDFFRRLK